MQLGSERLLDNLKKYPELRQKRVGLLAHPASVNSNLQHIVDYLTGNQISLTCAFGPQHGMLGDKQDNMIESKDYVDPRYGIPIYSLYSDVRRPTPKMLDSFDILLVDLQDVGTRIYTYITTLIYFLQECQNSDRQIWILDRPNPIGRKIEGHILSLEYESFVGAAEMPMRHGLTLGEAALWFKNKYSLNTEVRVIEMLDYEPEKSPSYGWPENELVWVNPSPNVPCLTTTRVFPGSVTLEGTLLSEGRGTTRPLEMFGHPEIDHYKVHDFLIQNFSPWLKGCVIRPCFFEPTFHKFKGQLCSGLQIHVDSSIYGYQEFTPYRLFAAYYKVIKQLYPQIDLWRQPPYEYETVRLPIDLLTGGELFRRWVDDAQKGLKDLEDQLKNDEEIWREERLPFLLY